MLADWNAIAPAAEPGSCNVRLADSAHPLDFRIGRDYRARYVFQLDSKGSPEPGIPAPKLAGVDCRLETLADDRLRLSLILANDADFPNFRLMCTGLMLATEGVSASRRGAGMVVAIRELHRWQEMLRPGQDRLLTRNEIIGLIGELLLLRDVLCPRLGVLAALRCWSGPEGHEQDFVLGGAIIEVKTQIVTADRRIRISSEDQLDPVQGRIFICNQGVAPSPAPNPTARTLNALVAEVRNMAAASDVRAAAILDIALLEARYEVRDEYEDEAWLLVDRTFYAVTGDFPRIERADLRPGVEMVTYSIRVADCQGYVTDLDEALAEAGA